MKKNSKCPKQKRGIRRPRILIYDVENSALEAFAWEKWNTNLIAIRRHKELLSVSWRWQGKKQTHICTREGHKTDRRVVEKLFNLFKRADMIIAHNGDRSDHKKAMSRFGKYRMGMPKITSSVDTLKVVKENFDLPSYSLEAVCEYFNLGKKMKGMTFDTWVYCIAQTPEETYFLEGIERDTKVTASIRATFKKKQRKAWAKMARYNKHDSVLAEALYGFLKKQGYIRNHPTLERIVNPKLIVKRGVCPQCGSLHARKRGFRATAARLQRQWQCQEPTCQAWFLTAVSRKEVKA